MIACVNHDENAIMTHAENHPDCYHFIEDVRNFAVVLKLKHIVADIRKKHPDSKINIWASLECTHFSIARGGLPKDADSRTLAEHLFMYVEHLDPDAIFIENVKEFMTWGPLDENNQPIDFLKGCSYHDWKEHIKGYGYDYDHRILNAADMDRDWETPSRSL